MKRQKKSFGRFFVDVVKGIYGTLKTNFQVYKDWVDECFSNIDDEYDKVWHNKVPFIDVSTGDMIAFDTSQKDENCPIIYLNHDGSDFHGHKLAENFVEFITTWSNIGGVGTEDWQFEPFYDYENKTLKSNGSAINKWKNWLKKTIIFQNIFHIKEEFMNTKSI